MTPLEIFKIAASMLAGLALFLTGMNALSDSLTKLTGGALNRMIGKITKNKYFAFLFGTALTAVVQSSSAVTVLSVGLVNSVVNFIILVLANIVAKKTADISIF